MSHLVADKMGNFLAQLAGAGKTKLVATVTDELLDRRKSQQALRQATEGLAYFYCDRNRAELRDPECIMNSLARQLAMPGDGSLVLLPPVIQLHSSKEKNSFASGAPTFEEAFDMLSDLCRVHGKITLIVDALDECEQRTRGKLISAFRSFVKASSRDSNIVRIF